MKEVRAGDELVADPEKLQVGHLTELTETDRLESAADHISQIEQIRPEVWSGLSETDREWRLRQVGGMLSEAYECPTPPFIGSQMAEIEGGVLLGAHSDSEYITRMNRELLREDNADEALRTYFHEFRHAYQHEMVDRYNSAFRNLCHDEASAAQWAENLKSGQYIRVQDDPEKYEAQSVEKDARDFAERLSAEMRRRQ